MLSLGDGRDLGEVTKRWEHFWHGEIFRRPVVLTGVPKEGTDLHEPSPLNERRYYNALNGFWEEQLSLFNRWIDATAFPGEMVPMASVDFGPDQWAAFFGAEFKFNESSLRTNWVEPVVEDWGSVLPLTLDENNPVFSKLLSYAKWLAERGEGRFLVSQIDAHSNADALSALRGPRNFMMDLYDCPELVESAMNDMRQSYKTIHESIALAGRMGGERGYGHYGIWNSKSFQVVQSDVICMLSPEHFRRFVMPALEEEIRFHDRAYFHLDGPGALKHLDDILSIPGYWILQWQPGDGQPPNWKWPDVLLKAQKAGKAVHVFGKGLDLEAVKSVQKQLDPARIIYSPDLHSEAEAGAFLNWLELKS